MARRIKVKLQDTTPARVFWLDPDATEGATLGTNVFLPDGTVGTPTTVRAWLGVTEAQDPRAPPRGGTGVTAHRLLQGLPLGDDHPQYTQWAQDEIITGFWSFRTNDGVIFETPELAGVDAGLRITVVPGADPANFGVGSEIAWWEGAGHLFAMRLVHTGEQAAEGNLDWYRHDNSAAGVLFLRFTRDSSQIQFAAGSASAPVLTTFSDLDTGAYFPAANTFGVATGGTLRFSVSTSLVTSTLVFRGPDGSATAPTYSFTSDTDTGFYLGATGSIGITHSGVFRVAISSTLFSVTLPVQGADGSAGTPEFSFTSDPNTGMYSVGADQLGFSTGGTLRLTLTTARLDAALPIQLQGYTVATLPAGVEGDTAYVTDALAPAYGVAVTGGGAVKIPVFYDGTNWITA